MAKYIEILSQVKGGDFYPAVLDVINNGRKYFADVLAKRSGNTNVPPLPILK